MDDSDLDVDVSSVAPELLGVEIEEKLHLKGYCTIDLNLHEDTIYEALEDIKLLRADTRFQTPPEQITDGLLGEDGSGEIADLPLPDEQDYGEGDALRRVDDALSGMAENCVGFLDSLGVASATRSPSLVVRGGPCDFDREELTEQTCSRWMSTFSMGKLMLLLFLGPNEAMLELEPYECGEEEMGAVEVPTRASTLVIFRCDMLRRRHVSSESDYALCCWITSQEGMSGPRGWLSMAPGSASEMPAGRELQGWARQRLEELCAMDLAGTLDEGSVPREWLRTMRHHYFKQGQSPAAVYGQAGHLPSTHDADELFWGLNSGADLMVEIPWNRWDHSLYYDEDPHSWMQSTFAGGGGVIKTAVRHCCFTEGIELFDNKFFSLSRPEAESMDPMQRHILETSWVCFYDAGMSKKDLKDSFTAVYIGSANPEWAYVNDRPMDEYAMTASNQSMLANRSSFVFGLRGPSTSIDCEMASASMALLMGAAAVVGSNERRTESFQDCDAACAGGAYLCLTPILWPRHGAFMNHHGRCFSFDASAQGYVRGELCMSMCLKRYGVPAEPEDASCYGTVAGWRVCNNGRGASLTAPCGPAEQEACSESLRHAGITELDVDGMECHGIGVLLSDAVEGSSVTSVLRGGDRKGESLILGASKTNVGAPCEACGMMQFAKVLFGILYGFNVPSLHFRQLNPHMELGGQSSLMLGGEAMPYRARSAFHGVASRGWGGTNVNLVAWYSADKNRSIVDKPPLERQEFNFWPGGGGTLSSSSKPLEGYFIMGSWNDQGKPEEMEPAGNGRYRYTVTLGMSCFETFQVWLDGDESRVLCPASPSAGSGSAAWGPAELVEAQELWWRIDGRVDAPASAGDGGAASLQDSPAAAPSKDAGKPGDRYEVLLRTAGRYRAVSWRKLGAEGEPKISKEMLGGSYYVTGAFNDWSLQEMKPMARRAGMYTLQVGPLKGRGGEFQICRNKDPDQALYPASPSAGSGEEVHGPDDQAGGSVWCLRPASPATTVFTIILYRKLEDGKDVRRVTWTSAERQEGPPK